MHTIDTENENLLTITQAAKHCPGRPSVATVWRWVLNGLRGIKLDSVKVDGRRYTSSEAIDRFISATTAHADGKPIPQRTPKRRKRETRKALEELEREDV